MKTVSLFGFLVLVGVCQTACSPSKEHTFRSAAARSPEAAAAPSPVGESAQTNLGTTRWRYVGPITPETTILDIGSPKNIEICVDNLNTTVNFQVTRQQCNSQDTTIQPVSTGCLSVGDVRKVTILQSQNQSVYAAGGVIKHVDFDEDKNLPPVDRSIAHEWSYTKGKNSAIYLDPQMAPRTLRICVNKGNFVNGWGVNFKSKGHSCNPTATNTFAVTGVVNQKYGITGACAVVEASELWIEGASNPAGPAQGTYQFLR